MPSTNPYVGPRSFEKREKLYGRDRELSHLTDRLISERIVLLHSPSGAGKTSLVQAGLVPRLGEEGFFVHPTIRVNLERSANLIKISDENQDDGSFNRYTFSTLLSLEERYPQEERFEHSHLARLSLDDYLSLRSKGDKRDGPEFLIFDQFEEILTIDPTDRAAKTAFFSQVGTALKKRERWALFAMRSDYIGLLEPYTRLVPTYFGNTFHLELLGVKAALEAIQKPARSAGVDFTDAAAQKLVDDLRRVHVQLLDGSLSSQLGLYVEPVQLQVVCYRLWENKADNDQDISEKDLASVGDVNQSLSEYYAQSVAKVAETSQLSERIIREWFNRKLITPEGIRLQARMGTETSEGLPNAAVRALENAHIIRAEKRAGQTWYELAHDRLIEPVRIDNNKWLETHLSLFQRQAAIWAEQGRSEGLLLHGAELEQAENESREINLTADEKTFLEACRVMRQRQQRDLTQRRIITAALVVSILLFFVAVFFSIRANNATGKFEAEAIKAQAASTQAIAQQSIAQAASTQAIAQQSTAQAASTQAIAQQSTAQAALGQALSSANEAATARANADLEKENALQQEKTAREQGRLAQANELVAQSILAQNNTLESLATLLAVEAFQISDHARSRIQLLNFVNNRVGLFLAQSSATGITPSLTFGPDSLSLVSASFSNCAKEYKYYLCRNDLFKVTKVRNTPLSDGRSVIELIQEKIMGIGSSGTLDAVTISPDGKTILTAYCAPDNNLLTRCESENLQRWDAATYEKIGNPIQVATNNYNVRNVILAYSPDGQTLAVAYDDTTIVLLETTNYAEIGRHQTTNGIIQLAFSPDSKQLAFVGGADRALIFLEIPGLETSKITLPGTQGFLISLAYNANGEILALGSSNGIISLWDTQTNSQIGQMYHRQSRILSLAFSPDNRILAAGHDNYYLTVWDIESRQALIRPISRHTGPVYSVKFSPDGKFLASASEEILLWDMDPASWQNKACEIAGRNFVQIEWEQYFPQETYRETCQK